MDRFQVEAIVRSAINSIRLPHVIGAAGLATGAALIKKLVDVILEKKRVNEEMRQAIMSILPEEYSEEEKRLLTDRIVYNI